MKQFSTGLYFGKNTFQRRVNGIILSQNDYSSKTVLDWHFHENPYIDFILKGGGVEIRKNAEVECYPGTWTICNTQEKHKNVKYINGSKFFFIECERSWFAKMNINPQDFADEFIIENQRVKNLLPQIILEANSQYDEAKLAIETLVVTLFVHFSDRKTDYKTAPNWLMELKNLLHDEPYQSFSLTELSNRFRVHPVTISRFFPHFFGSTISEYIRGIKLEKSFEMLSKKNMSLESVACNCGFADHAFFTRTFK